MTTVARIHHPIGLLLLLAAAYGRAETPAAVFRDANLYTVEVKASIPYPLEDDKATLRRGAGFLIDKERRLVLTAAHVVGRSPSTVELTFKERKPVPARKIYVDPFLDVAILSLPTEHLPPNAKAATLECNHQSQIGDPVGAFGHPWGNKYSGTRGIIAGLDGSADGVEMLQTDAAINPGNSGGPLIDLESGRVVGINVLRQGQKSNYAVPSPYVCTILRILQQGGDPTPPDIPLAFFRDDTNKRMLRVARVFPTDGSWPLQTGDVIQGVAGTTGPSVHNRTQLIDRLRGQKKTIRLLAQRDHEMKHIEVILTAPTPILALEAIEISGAVLGRSIAFGRLREFDIESEIQVLYVVPGSAAEINGVQGVDFVVAIDGHAIKNIKDVMPRVVDRSNANLTLHLMRLDTDDYGIVSHHEIELPAGVPREIRYAGPGN